MIIAVLLPLISSAQEKRTYTFVERDSALRLDVWSPEVPRGDRACVVAVFGGGFVSGRRDDQLQQSIARQLTARGYTVVSPDYRLGLLDTVHNKQYKGFSGITNMFQHTIDMAAEDCAAAVAYVVQHAGALNINPERIVLTGCSAGAIAVLQLDYCRANGLAAAAELPQGWMPAAVVKVRFCLMSQANCQGALKSRALISISLVRGSRLSSICGIFPSVLSEHHLLICSRVAGWVKSTE